MRETMPSESQAQNYTTPLTQPTLDSTSQNGAPKPKVSKTLLLLIIILSVLTVLGVGTSVFAFIKSSAKDSEISDLKAQLNQSADKPNDDTDYSDSDIDATISSQGIFFLSDALARYPYYLVAKSADASFDNQWASNQDSFYLLNMNELDTKNALKPFKLVETLQPIIDNTIASSLPASSTSATGGITTRSQCNSFDIFYTDPHGDNDLRPLFLPTPAEYNPETEIPVVVNYFCHTGSYDVVYYKATYIININDLKVNTYSSSSDFYNQS